MIEIDGSYLEGGGQIIRTAVAVSAITNQSVHLFNIRKGRDKPGLRPQHLHGITAAGKICDARIEGLSMNSTDILFAPGKIKGGAYVIDTKTAGSVTLMLQTLVPLGVYAHSSVELTLKGGTAVPFSPTIVYFSYAFCSILRKQGAIIEVEVRRHGFYPKGGGEVFVKIEPSTLRSFAMGERGEVKKLKASAVASHHLRASSVAERMLKAFSASVHDTDSSCSYVDANSPGCFITACAEYENGMLGASALGRRGKPAEELGSETADDLKRSVESDASVDTWMVDQLVPFMALSTHGTAQDSEVRIRSLTKHARTNIWVVEKFLDVTFSFDNGMLRCMKSNRAQRTTTNLA